MFKYDTICYSTDVGGQGSDSNRVHDMSDKSRLDFPSSVTVDGSVPSRSPHNYENVTFSYPSSPRTRIKTILPTKDNLR